MTARTFVKTGLPALLAAEIRGLEWLRVAGGPSLPQVVELTGDQLVLEWIEPGRPSPVAAREFGDGWRRTSPGSMPTPVARSRKSSSACPVSRVRRTRRRESTATSGAATCCGLLTSLHQLHPLLVHVRLFGGGYAEQVRAACRRALAQQFTARPRPHPGPERRRGGFPPRTVGA